MPFPYWLLPWQLALPDSDAVSRGLCLQHAEVEADAMANGHGDQPDTVLGAGVWTGEARGVHSAIGRGDVPTAGDCREGTWTQVSAGGHLPAENSDDFLTKTQLPAPVILFKEIGRDGERQWGWGQSGLTSPTSSNTTLPTRPRSSCRRLGGPASASRLPLSLSHGWHLSRRKEPTK